MRKKIACGLTTTSFAVDPRTPFDHLRSCAPPSPRPFWWLSCTLLEGSWAASGPQRACVMGATWSPLLRLAGELGKWKSFPDLLMPTCTLYLRAHLARGPSGPHHPGLLPDIGGTRTGALRGLRDTLVSSCSSPVSLWGQQLACALLSRRSIGARAAGLLWSAGILLLTSLPAGRCSRNRFPCPSFLAALTGGTSWLPKCQRAQIQENPFIQTVWTCSRAEGSWQSSLPTSLMTQLPPCHSAS